MTGIAFLLVIVTAIGCGSDAPAEMDTSITFEAPDASPDADAGADAAGDADAAPPTTVGMHCAVDSDCPADVPICLVDEGFRDGHCTDYCESDGDDTCPAGSHCAPIAFMTDVCLADCDPDAEDPCPLGFGCAEGAPAAAVCAPGCDVDADCPEGLACNPDDGGLVEGECYDPSAELGDPCTEPEQCPIDNWCIRERDRGYPGGTCTLFRCDEVDDTGCPDGFHCVFDFYRDPICLRGCDDDTDCRDGYACLPDDAFPERLRCTPACSSDAQCLEPALSCDEMAGRCG
jgi:hypothetical protein